MTIEYKPFTWVESLLRFQNICLHRSCSLPISKTTTFVIDNKAKTIPSNLYPQTLHDIRLELLINGIINTRNLEVAKDLVGRMTKKRVLGRNQKFSWELYIDDGDRSSMNLSGGRQKWLG